jgi:hypothetical protein
MSGIVGLIVPETLTPELDLGARALCQIPGTEINFLAPFSGVSLAAVGLIGRINTLEDDSAGLCLMVQGVALSPVEPYREVTAAEILQNYRLQGVKNWENFEGAFIIVLVDKAQRQVHIFNDRLGQLPLLYAQGPGWFCFGSQAKAIFPVVDLEPQLSIEGVIQFLAAGYPFGETSMFEGLSVLEPASQLTVGLDDLTTSFRRYWSLQYEPQWRTSRKKAMADLYDAVLEGHRINLCHDQVAYDLMLSGGWDSRGILGALEQLGSKPQTTKGWGVRDDLTGSDPEIAGRLARAFGVDYQFFSYDVKRLPRILRPWVCVSELMNDNLGWYIELPNCYPELYRSEAGFALVGDEIWGWDGPACDKQNAISKVLPPSLPDTVRKVLRQERLGEFVSDYKRRIQCIMDKSVSRNWTDLKDFLYLYIRVNRFIFSLGYFRELIISQRRPFLARPVLDVIRRMPRGMRPDKNGYLSMLQHYMPKTTSIPKNSTNSLADWEYLFRADPKIRQTFIDLLAPERVSKGVLGEVLDLEKLSQMRDQFFGAPPEKRSNDSQVKACWRGWLRKLSERTPGLSQLVHTIRGNAGSDFNTLRRVALCVALQEELPKFKAGLPELLLFQGSSGDAQGNRL